MITASAQKPFFFRYGSNAFILTPSAGVQFSSENLTDYYFGISNSESQRSGLNQYTPPAAVSPFIGLSTIYSFNQRWSIMLSTRLSRLDDNLVKSPMVSRQYVFTSITSLTYNFDI